MTGRPATLGALQEPKATTGNLNAQVRETHTGVVFLVGDKAYKVEKLLATDFLTSALRSFVSAPASAKSR